MTAKVSVMVDIVTLGHPTTEWKMSADMDAINVTAMTVT